jgi:small subunit ribosomal protein S35
MSTTRAYRKDETPSTASEEARSSGGTEALQDLPPPPPSEGGSSGISSIDSLNSLRVMDAVAKEHGFTSFDQYVKSSLRQKKRGVMDDRAMESAVQEIFKGGKLNRQHFWFDAEDPEVLTEEHDEFDEDDMTEMAHSKLEEIREMRQYARMAVWELPLLSSEWPPQGMLRSRQARLTLATSRRICQTFRASHRS